MTDAAATPKHPSKDPSDQKFRNMSLLQKGVFVCKAMVFLITFGFAYPNIFVD